MRRLAAIVLALTLSGLAAGCNGKQSAYKHADSEGIYLAADGLKYQVQLSRALNPALSEDRDILNELPPGTKPPARNETWFGVWLRVENDGDAVHTSSDNFEIVDTQGNRYDPVVLNPQRNIFAYRAVRLGPESQFPDPDSVAAQCCPRNGALLLFKLNDSVYQNRPIELEIRTPTVPERTEATVELDL